MSLGSRLGIAFMRAISDALSIVQCVIFGRALGRGTSFSARSIAVRYMSIATSPFAWQFTWMPARCTRSTQAFNVSCVSVMLPL